MSRPRDEEISEDQRIHLRAQEAIDRFFGAADDRLVVIERSVSTTGTPVRSRKAEMSA